MSVFFGPKNLVATIFFERGSNIILLSFLLQSKKTFWRGSEKNFPEGGPKRRKKKTATDGADRQSDGRTDNENYNSFISLT